MKKNILFIYPSSPNFSGQTKASELIVDVLTDDKQFIIYPLMFPSFQRKGRIKALLKWIISIIRFEIAFFENIFCRRSVLYLNLPLSWIAIVFMGLQSVFYKKNKKCRLICSLHSDAFTKWNNNNLLHKAFMYILKNSDIITTLGKRQEDALDKLGIKSYIRVPNAVDIPDWNADDILYDKSAQQINILHLSTLIETKGFSNYVEALKLLPKNNNWNAILCGPVLFTKYCKTFSTIKQKEEYVLQNIEYLSPYSTWIRGAYGIEKFELFKNADIFIFPSTFNAESLPLVVLEAAASGCAIICTKVGEIPNYFSNDEILFLDSPDAKEISDKVQQLLLNKNTIQKYKYNAYQKYLRFFSKEAYKLNWISLFNQ